MQQQQITTLDLRGLTLVLVAGTWIAGILLDAIVPLPAIALLIGAGASLLFLFPLWHHPQNRLIMLLIACLFFGAWRYTLSSPATDPHAIAAFIGEKVKLLGTVSDEPKVHGRSRTLVIAVTKIQKTGSSTWQDADGQLSVQTLGMLIEDPYGANYGDVVEVQGKLQPSQPPSPPSIFASMAFPRISVSQNEGNPIIGFFYHLRVTLATLITQSLPPSEASLLIALLLSLRTPALKPLIPAFNATGCAHLIAPSGFKVTIVAGLVISSVKRLYETPKSSRKLLPAQRRGNWRRGVATTLVLLSIGAFTLLSGAGPAAIRAGIMGSLLVIAPRIGRVYNIYTALALSALVMSAFDPFILWDVGFLLSFIGTLGIVLLTPFFQRRLHFLERLPLGTQLAEIFAVTLAAQTATLPLFAINFHEVSFIAPVTNILTVPLLGILLTLGVVLCSAGLLFLPLAALIGWVVRPFLFYMNMVVLLCFNLPGSYRNVGVIDKSLAWVYYALLAVTIYAIQQRQRDAANMATHAHQPLFPWSQRTKVLTQIGVALLIIMATGTTALATQPDRHLTITFLDVGPAQQQPQGEAILIRTPDAKTILIDGGLDATSLSQALDSRLPSWQRTLDVVLLTSPRAEHLGGLQDIVTRYQIGEVIDAGMLHPSTAYALWRKTIRDRSLHYAAVSQGTTITVGTQVGLQILWPTSHLHKGTDEIRDNGLVVRLIASGVRMLLLGATAQSKYALRGLLATLSPNYLQASIVQVIGEVDKQFPVELTEVLRQAQPSLLVITPGTLSAKLRKSGATSVIALPPSSNMGDTHLQVLQTAQAGTIEISSDNGGWGINTTQTE
ncbi:MAG: DNA internalization-related competence protein ComEC/Rec2 [Ktedonobacteraceae bacterium]